MTHQDTLEVFHKALQWIVDNPGAHPENIRWVCRDALEKDDVTHKPIDHDAVIIEQAARLRYNTWTDNQSIHCNRFPPWEELDESSRRQWREQVINDLQRIQDTVPTSD